MSGSEVVVPLAWDNWQVPIARTAPWAVNNDEDDGSTAVLLKAAPGAGKALYITHISLSKTTASADIAVTLEDSDATVYYGPIYLVDNAAGLFKRDWPYPIKLADNKALYVKGAGGKGNAFTIYVEGFTGQAPIV